MGDLRETHVHKHMLERADADQGINAPPQASSYEEWVAQNTQMEEMMQLQEANSIEADFTAEDVVENGTASS